MIRVDTKDNLLNDVAAFLGIDIGRLYLTIMDIYNESKIDYGFDYNKINQLSEDFIFTCTDKQIDEMYLCHLTRNIDCPPILFPLHTILTSKNSLSAFLKENELTFEFEDEQIKMKYKDRIIPKTEIYPEGEQEYYHRRLRNRFGFGETKDFCVNGFLFAINPETSTDGYYDQLLHGPEFLQDIDMVLSTDLCSDFRKLSKNYYALCRVPLNEVIFDGKDYINILTERTVTYLTICFDAIYDLYIDHSDRIGSNYIIRLNDIESIPVEKYIEI